jgi:YqxM protein
LYFILNLVVRYEEQKWFTKEEVILIRMKRLKSIRKIKKNTLLILKLFSIFYVSMGIMSYLISTTNASFNDVEEANTLLSAGEWEIEEPDPPPEDEAKGCSENHDGWDCSSLKFMNEGFKVYEDGTITIFADIKNDSENNMRTDGPGRAAIYYTPYKNGSAKDGELVKEISFNGIAAGELIRLEHTGTLADGKYIFIAYQSQGHPGKGVLWTNEIVIGDPQKSNKNENKGSNDSTETKSPIEAEDNGEQQSSEETSDSKEKEEIPSQPAPVNENTEGKAEDENNDSSNQNKSIKEDAPTEAAPDSNEQPGVEQDSR